MMQSTTHFRCQTSQCTTSNRQADQDQACVSACVRVRACVRVHVWKYRYRGGTKTAGHTHSRLISHLWVSKGAAASVTRYNSLVGHNNRLFCNHLLCPVWVDILFQANKPSILIVRLRVCLMWQCGRNKVNVVRLVGVLLFYKDIFISLWKWNEQERTEGVLSQFHHAVRRYCAECSAEQSQQVVSAKLH